MTFDDYTDVHVNRYYPNEDRFWISVTQSKPELNKERILALADFIETMPARQLNLSVIMYSPKLRRRWDNLLVEKRQGPFGLWGEKKTILARDIEACIGGLAIILFGDKKSSKNEYLKGFFSQAMTLLGISYDVARDLFFPPHLPGERVSKTPQQTAATLRHLAQTGVVNWKVSPQAG